MSAFTVLGEVANERRRQDAKWGEQNHPDGTGSLLLREESDSARMTCEAKFTQGNGTWHDILKEEFCEAMAEGDLFLLREELIQVQAVACAWVEAIDRRLAHGDVHLS